MIGKSIKLGLSGGYSGFKYYLKKSFNVNQYPTFLVYQFTNKCNSRCQMCNIWQKDSKGELSLDDLNKIFKKRIFSQLRWINLTGGEPFIRSDIVDVVKILNKLPKLEGIAIPSNGFLTQRIIENTEKILKVLDPKKFLSITLSIDGFEKTHDKIRGVPGGFNKVTRTLTELQKLKIKYPNFNVGVQPTITKTNLSEIVRFYHHMKKITPSIGFAVVLSSEGYYDNQENNLALTKKDKLEIARFFKRIISNDPQYGFYYSKLISMFKTGKRNFGCLAGFITCFMDPFGNISPCPVLSSNPKYCFGNLKSQVKLRHEEVWFSKTSMKIKKQLKKEPICKTCTMMCDFINVAKVEFYEFTLFMLQHPKMTRQLINKIRKEKNPYF